LRVEAGSAACADNLSTNSAGILTYRVEAPISAPPGTAHASSHGSSGTRQANRHRCCDGFRHAAVPKREVASGRTRKLTTACRSIAPGASIGIRRGRTC
jgi:hypothetical protein